VRRLFVPQFRSAIQQRNATNIQKWTNQKNMKFISKQLKTIIRGSIPHIKTRQMFWKFKSQISTTLFLYLDFRFHSRKKKKKNLIIIEI
jgi:hypothetical protein